MTSLPAHPEEAAAVSKDERSTNASRSSRQRTILAAGDLAALLVFGAIGLASHDEGVSLGVVARSIVPFVLSWFAIVWGIGAAQGWGPELRGWRVVAAWLVAGVMALVARAIVFDRELFNAFFVIGLVGNGLFLLAWRAVYARFPRERPLLGEDEAPAA